MFHLIASAIPAEQNALYSFCVNRYPVSPKEAHLSAAKKNDYYVHLYTLCIRQQGTSSISYTRRRTSLTSCHMNSIPKYSLSSYYHLSQYISDDILVHRRYDPEHNINRLISQNTDTFNIIYTVSFM